MAWKEYCAEYLLKELQESMDRCTGRLDMTEVLLKTALNTIQSINYVSITLFTAEGYILFKERNITSTCKCQKHADDLAATSQSCVLMICTIF